MKKTTKIAIIGGSGLYQLDGFKLIGSKKIVTPFGSPSDEVLELSFNECIFYFLPRHGRGHLINPSEINYRANIYALKSLGVDTVVSISAVGSLKEECAPGDFVVVDQFIDWTKGKRERTFFDKGIVGHVSCAYPVEMKLKERIFSVSKEAEVKTHLNGSYVCIEGPQFSSRAESEIYRTMKASVIGMTNLPEAYLAKEAGLAYSTIAMVTDYDCWKEEHCEVQEIMRVMKKNYESAQRVLAKLIPSLLNNPIEFKPENSFAVISNQDKLSSVQREMLEVILR